MDNSKLILEISTLELLEAKGKWENMINKCEELIREHPKEIELYSLYLNALSQLDRKETFEKIIKELPQAILETKKISEIIKVHNKVFTYNNYEFRLIKRIGTGGFAHVYKVQFVRKFKNLFSNNDAVSRFEKNKFYALKVILFNLSKADKNMQSRFDSETQIIMNLEHKNLVRGFAHNSNEDDFKLFMEYIDGYNLDEYHKKKQEEGKLLLPEALFIVKEIASGIQELHKHNTIHRDIKPFNIMLSKDGKTVKIIDFGISKQELNKHTQTLIPLGTRLWSAPEQSAKKNKKTDRKKADIFSLTTILYELIYGYPTFIKYNDSPHMINDIKEKNIYDKHLLSNMNIELLKFIKKNLSGKPAKRDDIKTYINKLNYFIEQHEKYGYLPQGIREKIYRYFHKKESGV